MEENEPTQRRPRTGKPAFSTPDQPISPARPAKAPPSVTFQPPAEGGSGTSADPSAAVPPARSRQDPRKAAPSKAAPQRSARSAGGAEPSTQQSRSGARQAPKGPAPVQPQTRSAPRKSRPASDAAVAETPAGTATAAETETTGATAEEAVPEGAAKTEAAPETEAGAGPGSAAASGPVRRSTAETKVTSPGRSRAKAAPTPAKAASKAAAPEKRQPRKRATPAAPPPAPAKAEPAVDVASTPGPAPEDQIAPEPPSETQTGPEDAASVERGADPEAGTASDNGTPPEAPSAGESSAVGAAEAARAAASSPSVTERPVVPGLVKPGSATAAAEAIPTGGRRTGTTSPAAEPPATAPGQPGAVVPAGAIVPPAADAETDPVSVDVWGRVLADPSRSPELLALAAAQVVGPRAREWARRSRAAYPNATPDGLARLAVQQFTRFGIVGSFFSAIAGAYAPVALLGSAAFTHAALVLHVAAAYGVDPAAPARAVDLLLLTRVHAEREDAEAAVAAAQEQAAGVLSGGAWRLGRMLAAQAGGWAAVRAVNRFFPGSGLLTAVLASRGAADSLAARAIIHYRSGHREAVAAGSSG